MAETVNARKRLHLYQLLLSYIGQKFYFEWVVKQRQLLSMIICKFVPSHFRKMWTSIPLMSHKGPFIRELASAWIFIISLSGYVQQ